MSRVRDLSAAWRARAADLARYGADAIARALATVADELDAALQCEATVTLSLTQAATESGYSINHLARLVRAGVIRNAGTGRKPRIRRADLPKRVRRVAAKQPQLYDVDADARSLLSATRLHDNGGEHGL